MPINQSAVVPWRKVNGDIEVLLITSRTTGLWSIPKGWIEDGLSPQESAAKEAHEEAGVQGKVGQKGIGEFQYSKNGKNFTVTVFPLEVIMVWDEWPEKKERRRRWVPLASVTAFVKDPSLLRVIQAVAFAKPV